MTLVAMLRQYRPDGCLKKRDLGRLVSRLGRTAQAARERQPEAVQSNGRLHGKGEERRKAAYGVIFHPGRRCSTLCQLPALEGPDRTRRACGYDLVNVHPRERSVRHGLFDFPIIL